MRVSNLSNLHSTVETLQRCIHGRSIGDLIRLQVDGSRKQRIQLKTRVDREDKKDELKCEKGIDARNIKIRKGIESCVERGGSV